MKYTEYSEARDAAWEILIACEINRLPVDLNTVLRCLDIVAYPYNKNRVALEAMGLAEAARKTSGLTFYRASKPVVLYDDAAPPRRIRFTIAHELGHIILGHVAPGECTVRNREPHPQDSPMEQTANRFAVDLLAPACVLWGLGLRGPDEIETVCGISAQAAAYRAQRMELLLQRGRFLRHPLEAAVYHQFCPFIREYLGQG